MSVIITATLGDGHLTRRNREIEHLEIVSKLGEPHRCTIRFDLDTNFTDSLQDYHGQMSVTIANEDGTDTTTLFEGVMTGGTQDHQLRGGSRFEVTASSPLLLNMERHRSATFAPTSWDDAASQLGLEIKGPKRFKVPDGGYRMFGESRLEFARRMADDAGCYLVERDGEVQLRSEFDDADRHLLTWGRELLALRARSVLANHTWRGGVYEQRAKADYRFRSQRKEPVVTGALKLTEAVKQIAPSYANDAEPNLLMSDSRAPFRDVFRDGLQRESERVLGTAVVIEGESRDFQLRLSETVQVDDAPNFPLTGSNGVFGVVALTHLWDASEYRNRFVGSPWKNFSNFERPPLRVPSGPFLAEVMETEPEVVALGVIKVRMAHMDRSAEHFLFARVVTPFAGNQRGMIFLPEPGDEVLIYFAQGDPEHPLCLGSLWNGKDSCAGQEPKQIITKSGNVLALHDDGWIELYTPGGKCMLQMSGTDDGPPRVTLHSEGDLILEAKGEIQLRAASLHEHISGGVQQKFGGDVDVKIGGSLNTKVDSNVSHEGATVVTKGGAGKLTLTDASSVLEGAMAIVKGGSMVVVTGGTVQLNPPVVPPEIPIIAIPPQLPGELKSSWGKRNTPDETPKFDSAQDPPPSGS